MTVFKANTGMELNALAELVMESRAVKRTCARQMLGLLATQRATNVRVRLDIGLLHLVVS